MATSILDVPGIGPFEVDTNTTLGIELSHYSRDIGDAQAFLMHRTEQWPEDAYGNTFLANALNHIGMSMFPSEWTGHELSARSLPRFKTSHDIHSPLVTVGIEAIAAMAELAGEPFESDEVIPSVKDTLIEAYRRDDAAMQFIADLRNVRTAIREMAAPAVRRAETVRETVRLALRDGVIAAIPLLKDGGKFEEPIEREAWNVPALARHRLVTCDIDPSGLYRVGTLPTHWMFLQNSDIEIVLGQDHGTQKRGAKPKAIWPAAYKYVLELRKDNGPLGQDQPGWENQAAVEGLVADFIGSRGYPSSESTIRKHTKEALAEAEAEIEAGNSSP